MKIKQLLVSLVAAATALVATAQTQGYKDGIEYFKADQFDNAKEILTKTLNDAGTDRASALYYLGACELRDGNAAAASNYFNEGIAADPKNGLNYVGLGTMLLKNGDAKGAAEQFKAATKAQNKAPIYVAIARAYYNQDPVTYAKEYEKNMESAVGKDKKSVDYYMMKADKNRDEAIAEGEGSTKINEAAEEYNQAIYFNSMAPEAYVKYSRLFAKANPAYAISKLQEAKSLMPNSAMIQRELAERFYDNDQFTKAAAEYKEYLNNPNHFVQDEERYIVLLYFGEKYDESLALAKQILAKNPNSVQAARLEFLDLDKLGRREEARAAAEKFFAMPGVNFTANDYTSYAGILNELEDYDGEIQALQQAYNVSKKPELLKSISTAWSQNGSRALKAEDQAKANECYVNSLNAFKQYMAEATPSTQDYVDLGSRYQNVAATSEAGSEAKSAAINGAIEAIDHVIELVPNNFIPYRNKARMLLVKNDNQPSEEQMQTYVKMIELLDLDPENRNDRADTYREGYAQIASYYIAEKNTAEAKNWYLKMLELDPDNEALKAYIEKMK